jgi:hypothetical protein
VASLTSQKGGQRKVGNSNMERSHIDTTWKQNTMQMFLLTGAFLVKYDGYRLLGFLADGAVCLRTRNGKDWTPKFPSIAASLEKLKPMTPCWIWRRWF